MTRYPGAFGSQGMFGMPQGWSGGYGQQGYGQPRSFAAFGDSSMGYPQQGGMGGQQQFGGQAGYGVNPFFLQSMMQAFAPYGQGGAQPKTMQGGQAGSGVQYGGSIQQQISRFQPLPPVQQPPVQQPPTQQPPWAPPPVSPPPVPPMQPPAGVPGAARTYQSFIPPSQFGGPATRPTSGQGWEYLNQSARNSAVGDGFSGPRNGFLYVGGQRMQPTIDNGGPQDMAALAKFGYNPQGGMFR